jgi:hypothetical protein
MIIKVAKCDKCIYKDDCSGISISAQTTKSCALLMIMIYMKKMKEKIVNRLTDGI